MPDTTKGAFTIQEVRDQTLKNAWSNNFPFSESGGDLFLWGKNTAGHLGQNDTVDRSSPIQVAGKYIDVAGSDEQFIYLKTNGTLFVSGESTPVAILPGINRSSPTQIPGTTWCKLAASQLSGASAYAIKTDNTLWAWGRNDGELGFNNTIVASSPIQIPGAWCDIRAGYTRAAGKRTDNVWYVWGCNNFGRLGLNDSTNRSSPVILPGSWRELFPDANSAFFGIKNDNTLWGWGINNVGNIGDNTVICRSSPIQIPGTTWTCVAPSNSLTVALKSDNTLWSWGENSNGGLGTNQADTLRRSSPVQIPGLWCQISSGNEQNLIFGIKTDGTLWGWGGTNGFGSIGDGFNIPRSSPVQIPGTWLCIPKMNGNKASAAIRA
jgi:hypothetical protein